MKRILRGKVMWAGLAMAAGTFGTVSTANADPEAGTGTRPPTTNGEVYGERQTGHFGDPGKGYFGNPADGYFTNSKFDPIRGKQQGNVPPVAKTGADAKAADAPDPYSPHVKLDEPVKTATTQDDGSVKKPHTTRHKKPKPAPAPDDAAQ